MLKESELSSELQGVDRLTIDEHGSVGWLNLSGKLTYSQPFLSIADWHSNKEKGSRL